MHSANRRAKEVESGDGVERTMSTEVNGETTITAERGFAAMFEFLQSYWSEMSTAQVADVLGDVHPAYGARSSDPAAWFDWLRAVEKARANESLS